MSVVYVVWSPEGGGYIGQDKSAQGSPEGPFPRIKDHIDYIFDRKYPRDGCSNLMKDYGFGNLLYGYWDSKEGFGIPATWAAFCKYCCIKPDSLDEEVKMGLSEFCHIYFNSPLVWNDRDLAAYNRAIGGGKSLTIDLGNWPPIKALLDNYTIQDKDWRKSTELAVADVYDVLIKRAGTREFLTPENANKVLYAPRYAFFSICRDLIPRLAFIEDRNLIDFLSSTNLTIAILTKQEGIKDDIKGKVSSQLQGAIKKVLDTVGQSNNIEYEIEDGLRNLFGKDAAESITNQIYKKMSSFYSKLIDKLKTRKPEDLKNLKTRIQWDKFFSSTLFLKRAEVLAKSKSKNIPRWVELAKEECANPVPNKRIDNNYIKGILYDHFLEVYYKVCADGKLKVKPASTLTRFVVNEDTWLMTRMQQWYSGLGFSTSSSTIVNWISLYRALVSRNRTFTEINLGNKNTEKGKAFQTPYFTKNNWSYYYLWKSQLLGLANYYSTASINDILFEWF